MGEEVIVDRGLINKRMDELNAYWEELEAKTPEGSIFIRVTNAYDPEDTDYLEADCE